MSARVAAYPVRDRNSTIYTTRTDPLRKLRKKLDKAAGKNTLSGILAKNKMTKKG
jgi:hypothetical protein